MVFSRFDKLRLRSKFLLLGVTLLALIVFPISLYWGEVNEDIEGYKTERQGLPVAKILLQSLRHLSSQRVLSINYLGNYLSQDEFDRGAFLTDDFFNAILDSSELKNNLALRKKITEIYDNWRLLNHDIRSRKINFEKTVDEYQILIQKNLRLIDQMLDSYRLSLDPDIDGYYLMSSSLIRSPVLLSYLAQADMYFNYARAQLYLSDSTIKKISRLMVDAVDQSIIINDELNKVVGEEDLTIDPVVREFNREQSLLITMNNRSLVDSFRNVNVSELDLQANDFTNVQNNLDSIIIKVLLLLDRSLQLRVDKKLQSMYRLLSYVVSFIIFIAIFSLHFVRGLLAKLGGEPEFALKIVEHITQGDLSYPVPPSPDGSLLQQMQLMQFKLNENQRLKSDFVSTVSHELRTPLTSINGALSLTLNNQLGEIPEQAKKMLSMAHRNSLQLTRLINDLLDIDKLAAGKMQLELSAYFIMPILDAALEQMLSYAETYHVVIVCVSREDQAMVMVDESRLLQVLNNLLSNAIKYSPSGACVEVAVKSIDDYVQVTVKDFGKGIPASFQPKIFQRFSQSDSSSTREKGGTGLGLAISQELMRNMQGVIGFESVEGNGAEFYIRLPLIFE